MGKRMSREHLFASPLKCEGNALPLALFRKKPAKGVEKQGEEGKKRRTPVWATEGWVTEVFACPYPAALLSSIV
jgi:hypothetical protein